MKNFKLFFAAMCCLFLFVDVAQATISLTQRSISTDANNSRSLHVIELSITADDDDFYVPQGVLATYEPASMDPVGMIFSFEDGNGNEVVGGLNYSGTITSTADIIVGPNGLQYYRIDDGATEVFEVSVVVLCANNAPGVVHQVRLTDILATENINFGITTIVSPSPSDFTTSPATTCSSVSGTNLTIDVIDVEDGTEMTTLPSYPMHNHGVQAYEAEFEVGADMHSVTIVPVIEGSNLGDWASHVYHTEVTATVYRNNGIDIPFRETSGSISAPSIFLGTLYDDDEVFLSVKTYLNGCVDDITEQDSFYVTAEISGIELSDPGTIKTHSFAGGVIVKPFLPDDNQEADINQVVGAGDGMGYEPLSTQTEDIVVFIDYEKHDFDIIDTWFNFQLNSPDGRTFLASEYIWGLDNIYDVQYSDNEILIENFEESGTRTPLGTMDVPGVWELHMTVLSHTMCEAISATKIIFVEEKVSTGIQELMENGIRLDQSNGLVSLNSPVSVTASLYNAAGALVGTEKGTSISLEAAPGINLLVVSDGKETFSTKINNPR